MKLYYIICFACFIAEEIRLFLGLTCTVKALCCHEAEKLLERREMAMLSRNLHHDAGPGCEE